jgi:hypothetical protein
MDIRNVANNGKVERANDRPQRAEHKRGDGSPAVARDEAAISPSGRETAAAVTGLAERARRDASDRDAVVQAAMKKLVSGELDSEGVQRETARRLLGARFLAE